MTTSPVLLTVFNRPDTTARVFETIRAARPAQLFVAADGPRPGRPGEAERCAETRRIATDVDWPCEVKTLFRDHNLGCSRALSSAITWFFSEASAGIVLEDDTVPVPTFFDYCTKLLEEYREDKNVFMITGYTATPRERGPHGHWLSRYGSVWGWATWADRWQLYERTIPNFETEFGRARARRFIRAWEATFWKTRIEWGRTGVVDTWDWQWYFVLFKNSGRCVRPTLNLVANVGYGHPEAAHTLKADPVIQQHVARDPTDVDLTRRVPPLRFEDPRLVSREILKHQRITLMHYLQWSLPDQVNGLVRGWLRRGGLQPSQLLRRRRRDRPIG